MSRGMNSGAVLVMGGARGLRGAGVTGGGDVAVVTGRNAEGPGAVRSSVRKRSQISHEHPTLCRCFLSRSRRCPWAFSAQSADLKGYYRYPALGPDRIVFTAEGDLWSVPISGGVASRLTTHPGEETRAVFSGDGKTLAFAATYEGADRGVHHAAGGRAADAADVRGARGRCR
jgi:hypothetical protein